MTRGPTPRPAEERFWAKVEKTETCWLWTAATDSWGYGVFHPVRSRIVGSHRWSYEYHKGPIPQGLTIDHLCRVRHCVNPEHLEAVTIGENLRRVPRSPFCPSGHEYTPENTHIRLGGHGYTTRECRACNRARKRRQKTPAQ